MIKPYQLPELLDHVDDALIHVTGLIEHLADREGDHGTALWELVNVLVDAREVWAFKHDTTPETDPATGMPVEPDKP